MADEKQIDEQALAQIAANEKKQIFEDNEFDPLTLVERIYHLWWNWADFELIVTKPTLPIYSPPKIIMPEPTDDSDEQEFVYSIQDKGYKMSSSKGEDMFSAGMSMCKMYLTIEKMIYILIERLKASGIDTDTEVQVSFEGHELCQRKAFESVINLTYNVIVTNFDPGAWGERYLQTVKRMADKGYGYPSESPRDTCRHASHSASRPKQ
jgi:hypothetical protein